MVGGKYLEGVMGMSLPSIDFHPFWKDKKAPQDTKLRDCFYPSKKDEIGTTAKVHPQHNNGTPINYNSLPRGSREILWHCSSV